MSGFSEGMISYGKESFHTPRKEPHFILNSEGPYENGKQKTQFDELFFGGGLGTFCLHGASGIFDYHFRRQAGTNWMGFVRDELAEGLDFGGFVASFLRKILSKAVLSVLSLIGFPRIPSISCSFMPFKTMS